MELKKAKYQRNIIKMKAQIECSRAYVKQHLEMGTQEKNTVLQTQVMKELWNEQSASDPQG